MPNQETMYNRVLSHANCVLDSEAGSVSPIEIATYADGENVAIECMKCSEVIIDFNIEGEVKQ